MDIVPALPLDLLAVAAPQGRAPSGFPVLGDPEGDDAAPLLPFDALLAQLLAEPPPAGESLPETGNGLPLLPSVLPALGPPAAFVPETEPVPAALTFALGAQGLPVPAPAAGTAPTLPEVSAQSAQPVTARPMEWSLPAADAEPVQAGAELPVGDADGQASFAAHQFSLPADAEQPDARPVQTAPVPVAAEATQPQPAARVLAALAAAASAPADRAAARTAKPAPASADRAVAPSASARAAAALDPPAEVAAPVDGLESPPPAAAADAPVAVIETPWRGESRLPPPPSLTVDAAAPSPAFAQSPAPNAGNAAAPAAAPTHAPPAHPHGSVDTTAARWHDALASRVQWLVDHDVGEARLKLNPPELGALDVKISLQDDKTFVQLTAANSAARDELAQSLPRLRDLLSANGLELGGATVSGGRDQRSAPYAHAERSLAELDASGAIAAAEPRRSSAAGRSQIDVFA